LLGSEAEGLGDAGRVCELDEAELVLSLLVGVLLAIAHAEVHDDAALVGVLEELLEAADVYLADGVHPDGPVRLLLVQVLHPLQDVDRNGRLAAAVYFLQLVDALVVGQVVPDEQLLQPALPLYLPHALQDALARQEVEPKSQGLQAAVLIRNQVGNNRLEPFVSDPIVAQLQKLEGGVEAYDVIGNRFGPVVSDLVVEDVQESKGLVVLEGFGELICS
jgi:hypothetical protein